MTQVKNKLIFFTYIIAFILGILLSYNILRFYDEKRFSNDNKIILEVEEISQSDIVEQKSVIDESAVLPCGGVAIYLTEHICEIPEIKVPASEIIVVKEEIKQEPINPYISIIDNLTEEEIDLICKITYKESGNQCDEGQKAVIQVILNRVMYEGCFADTVEGVLSAPQQFSTWEGRNNISQEHIDITKEKLNLVYTEEEVFQKYIDEMGFEDIKPTDYVYFGRDIRSEMKHCIQIQEHWFGTR